MRADLLIVNELGYPPFSQPGGTLLFHLLSRLYKHTSVAITYNPNLGKWFNVFGGAKMTTTSLDRLRITAILQKPALRASASAPAEPVRQVSPVARSHA